jgi:hypothetical protein
MNEQFPTYLKSNNIGDIGVNAVSQVVNDEMKLIFKRNDAEYDFGIDGYIEIVTEEGSVTGQIIGVQIKCGDSFFKTKTKTGFTFYGDNKHLGYYGNVPFPIIIVICDPQTRYCYWQEFSLEKTEQTKTSWKINIPKRNILSKSSKEKILELVGEPKDYSKEAQAQWELTQSLKDASLVHYAIPREDIEKGNVKNLKSFFDRILSNDVLAESLQSKIEVSVDGYTFDKRELWEIREVRRWVQKAEPKIKYWFFFCANRKNTGTLTWLMACLTDVEYDYVDPENSLRIKIKMVTKPLREVIKRNFSHLNELTERYEIPLSENTRITTDAMHSIGVDKLQKSADKRVK